MCYNQMVSGAAVSTVKQHNVTNAGVSLKYCQYLSSLSITLLWASEIVAVLPMHAEGIQSIKRSL